MLMKRMRSTFPNILIYRKLTLLNSVFIYMYSKEKYLRENVLRIKTLTKKYFEEKRFKIYYVSKHNIDSACDGKI